MKKYLIGLLAMAIPMVMVVGCGNGGNDAPPPAATTPTEVSTPAEPPAQDDPTDEWVAPELPTEEEDASVPGAANLALVETPTAGRLLGRDGVPLTRAEILAITEAAPAPSGQVVIGDTTGAQGNFVAYATFSSESTGQWFNSLLTTGRGTMVMDFDGQWHLNPMVNREAPTIVNNPDGTRTYTFHLYTDNLWSDGTPITAIDYVFNIIAHSSPALRDIGGTTNTGLWIDGFFEFLDGRRYEGEPTDIDGNIIPGLTQNDDGEWVDGDEVVEGTPASHFRGIRLYGDDSFSVTIHERGIPFVFDFLYQAWGVLPFHAWNAGGEITLTDTPNGVLVEGLTSELLDEVVNSPNGLRYNPTVFAGAYVLRSFDEATSNMIVDRNPLFQGTWDGFMPQIQTIALVNSDSATIMDTLRVGEIDMVHAQRGGEQIQEGWNIVEDLGLHRGADFPRHGYGYLGWHGDHGIGQFPHVRRAVAWMIDRHDFARQFTGGWGTVQHGPYALRGWEFQAVGHELYSHPDFTHYGLNPANAVAELEAGGWTLNADGDDFNPDVDQWRYKDVTGLYNWTGVPVEGTTVTEDGRDLMRLEAIWAANDNNVSNIMRVVLPPVAESVGMNIIEELYPAGTSNVPAWQRSPGTPYAEGGDRFQAHSIYTLAVGLTTPAQLWNSWSNYPEQAAPGFNTTWHGDPELHRLAWAMRPIDASQDGWEEEYLDLWLQFQLRYNYVMPILPLYADDDHDFVPLWLGNWDSHAVWDFRHAIKRAYDGR